MEAREAGRTDERRQFALPGAAPLAPMPARREAVSADSRPALPERPPSHPPVAVARGLPATLRRALDGEPERGNGFLFAPVFMAAGALSYFTLAAEPSFLPLLLSFVLASGLAFALLSRPLLHAALVAAAMVCAGMLAGKVETWRAATPMLGSEITTRLTGRVVRIEHQASGRVRLTLDLVATERPQLRYAPHRIRATARAAPEGLVPGETVQGVARLMPPSGPVRPDSYDFAFESYFSGIGAVGFFLSRPERVAETGPPDFGERLAAWVEEWRGRMAARIEAQISGPEGAIAAALITGIRAGIPEEINEALRVTGLYHIISISGLHMALVAGTLMVSLRAGFALFPSFSMRRPVKKYAAAAALAATAFYLALSGGDVAAQRSFIMLAVMLAAVIVDRAALTMRNLAISALIILIVAPHEVVGPSFQMSFAATAALVAAYAAWRDRRERRPRASISRGMPVAMLRTGLGYAAGLSMTSVVAGLATALFTAWHFQQVSPLGLVANLAAMPVVSVAVMPMAVLTALLMPFGLDAAPLWVMGQGIAAMNAIALWLAERSAFDATGAIPLAAVLVLTVALAVLTMATSALRWLALPLIGLGVGLLAARDLPDAFVSEDAVLVAMRLEDGRIAVNRPRPRAFTLDNWRRAFGGGEIVRPVDAAPGEVMESRLATAGFSCRDGLCLVDRGDGAVLAHAADAAAARPACGVAGLIVIADATARSPCGQGEAAVITARDLARKGSAEIRFGQGPAAIRFAITEPYRPWHEHRRFSRAARGLAPWRRQERDQPRSDDQTG
ncbi:MAG: ComEC family competence protein [Aquamicrobium sp.]|uniref:ComEC/Rec2 family competence protein n=1 Tax=Aquamicrobium sp. TaxID=1872579 RepID=UPI00349EE0D6|nr:ComEC family competence protein [Aquamicrobium sp.]